MTKCLHEACMNEAEDMSSYCKDCVNLPIQECEKCKRNPLDKHSGLDQTIKKMIQANREEEDEQMHKVLTKVIHFLMYLIGFVVLLKIVSVIIR